MLSDKSYRTQVSPNESFPFTMFTICETHCSPPGPGYHYLHWHEELQFTFVTRGTIAIQVNGTEYELKSKDAIFINSGFLHMTSRISPEGEYISFNFPSRFLSFFFGSELEQDYVIPFTSNYRFPVVLFEADGSWKESLVEKLEALTDLCKSEVYGKNYEIAIRTADIWLTMIRHTKDNLPAQNPSSVHMQEKLQYMLSFIHHNYAKDIALEDIADAAHVSPGDCCRSFKKVLHITPYKYLLHFRILKSADLLKETGFSVAEIAGMVGFNDSSHFIQFFKKQMSLTPTAYRKRLPL